MKPERKNQFIEKILVYLKKVIDNDVEYIRIKNLLSTFQSQRDFTVFKKDFEIPLLKGKIIHAIRNSNIGIETEKRVMKSTSLSELRTIYDEVELERRKIQFLITLSKNEKIVSTKEIEVIMNSLSIENFKNNINNLDYTKKILLGLISSSKKIVTETKNSLKTIYTPMGNKR